MSSIIVPSSSGRVFAQPSPVVYLNAFSTRQRRANIFFKSNQNRTEAGVQQTRLKHPARRQGLTIRAAAAAEGQGFASDAGRQLMA